MPEWKVSKFELESLIRGFTVSEREGWNRVSPEEYSHLPISSTKFPILTA